MIRLLKLFSYNQFLSSGGYLPLPLGYIHVFLNVFFFKTTQAIFTRFHMEPCVERVLTICSNDFAPLNKMAAMPIYGKTLKNLLLQNQESFEAACIAMRTQVLPNLFK